MDAIHAIVIDPSVAGRLAIREVEPPVPAPSEALVRVQAVSLNAVEVHSIAAAKAGWRPGWDLAGVVEQAAADGSDCILLYVQNFLEQPEKYGRWIIGLRL